MSPMPMQEVKLKQ